jgi:hypothetical protein
MGPIQKFAGVRKQSSLVAFALHQFELARQGTFVKFAGYYRQADVAHGAEKTILGENLNRLLYTFLLLLALSGCTLPVTRLNVSDISRSESTKVMDLRPSSEKQFENFSLVVTSDAYGTYRIPDTSMQPSAARLLQHRAFEKFGAGAGQEIKLYHLVAYSNLQAGLRQTAAAAAIGGALGVVVGGTPPKSMSATQSKVIDGATFVTLPGEEYKRAISSAQENPGRGAVHIIYIETEVGGRRVFSRTIGPFAATEGVNPPATFLEAAVEFHLAQY